MTRFISKAANKNCELDPVSTWIMILNHCDPLQWIPPCRSIPVHPEVCSHHPGSEKIDTRSERPGKLQANFKPHFYVETSWALRIRTIDVLPHRQRSPSWAAVRLHEKQVNGDGRSKGPVRYVCSCRRSQVNAVEFPWSERSVWHCRSWETNAATSFQFWHGRICARMDQIVSRGSYSIRSLRRSRIYHYGCPLRCSSGFHTRPSRLQSIYVRYHPRSRVRGWPSGLRSCYSVRVLHSTIQDFWLYRINQGMDEKQSTSTESNQDEVLGWIIQLPWQVRVNGSDSGFWWACGSSNKGSRPGRHHR